MFMIPILALVSMYSTWKPIDLSVYIHLQYIHEYCIYKYIYYVYNCIMISILLPHSCFKHSRVFKPGALPSPGQNHHRHLLSSTRSAAAAGGSKLCGERNLEILEIFEEKSWWKLFVVTKRRSAFLFVVKDLFSGYLLLVSGSVTRSST